MDVRRAAGSCRGCPALPAWPVAMTYDVYCAAAAAVDGLDKTRDATTVAGARDSIIHVASPSIVVSDATL